MVESELGMPARIPPPSAVGGVRVVKVKKDAGANGDATHAPTYTYSIYRADSAALAAADRLATTLTPRTNRMYGAITYAADGTFGLAFILNGTWYLYAVEEVPQLDTCAP